MMSETPVLIVGGGPTGLVLGIELARRRVPFRLIDQHPRPLRWDRATVVKPRSLEVFAGMGVADECVRRGRILRGVNLFSGETKVASYRFEGVDSPFPFMLSIPEDEAVRQRRRCSTPTRPSAGQSPRPLPAPAPKRKCA
jgi:2-polyprenyl-6-methoxyphenol hydroxylase-like FAD-dependent oxidoreductase